MRQTLDDFITLVDVSIQDKPVKEIAPRAFRLFNFKTRQHRDFIQKLNLCDIARLYS
jgi:hypothetical protein